MIGWLLRRFRWAILGWAARSIARLGFQRSIDKAGTRIEDALPAPVAKVADRLPGDVVRAGAAAMVAADRTKAVSTGARSVARSSRRLLGTRSAVKNRAAAVAGEIRSETENARRRIRSEALQRTDQFGPATEALLDLRGRAHEPAPLPEVTEAIEPGRRRFRPALPAPPVNRVQRTYQRPTKPWDRPLRGRKGS